MASTTALPRAASRPCTMTSSPWRPRSSATALPIPEEAPVTSAEAFKVSLFVHTNVLEIRGPYNLTLLKCGVTRDQAPPFTRVADSQSIEWSCLQCLCRRGNFRDGQISLDEGKRFVRNVPPPVVDGNRVSRVRDLLNLGHEVVAFLLFECRVGDRPWHDMIFLAVEDQQGSSLWVLLDLCLRPRVEVGCSGLEERFSGCGHGELLVKLLGLIFADGVGEGVAELVEG